MSRILRDVCLALVALSPIFIGAAFAFGSPLRTDTATPKHSACAKTVIKDWANDGVVEGDYHPRCFRQAIRQLPEDLRAYSSAEEDIHQALQQALLQRNRS
jgi:hypothetical protein